MYNLNVNFLVYKKAINKMKNKLKFFHIDEIGNAPWERNFRRVMPPDNILGAQTRSNKKSAGTLKNTNSNNLWRLAL